MFGEFRLDATAIFSVRPGNFASSVRGGVDCDCVQMEKVQCQPPGTGFSRRRRGIVPLMFFAASL
jgi:hypothetical protein